MSFVSDPRQIDLVISKSSISLNYQRIVTYVRDQGSASHPRARGSLRVETGTWRESEDWGEIQSFCRKRAGWRLGCVVSDAKVPSSERIISISTMTPRVTFVLVRSDQAGLRVRSFVSRRSVRTNRTPKCHRRSTRVRNPVWRASEDWFDLRVFRDSPNSKALRALIPLDESEFCDALRLVPVSRRLWSWVISRTRRVRCSTSTERSRLNCFVG